MMFRRSDEKWIYSVYDDDEIGDFPRQATWNMPIHEFVSKKRRLHFKSYSQVCIRYRNLLAAFAGSSLTRKLAELIIK